MLRLTPFLRKLTLTIHILASIGWFGSVTVFLVLAITGMVTTTGDSDGSTQLVRSVYLTTKLITWFVIVPFALASLVSGIIQSLGTTWGLLRHYWVVVKLLLTVFATIVLLIHTRPVDEIAATAATNTAVLSSARDLYELRRQLLVDAGAAVLVLVTATVLAVYKPRGLTPYGQRAVTKAAVATTAAARSRP